MEIKQIPVYKYEELSEEAKDRVRAKYKVSDDWFQELDEEVIEKLGTLGFYNVETRFSLSGQGSGFSFTGNIDLEKYLTGIVRNERHQDETYLPILQALIDNNITITESIIKRDRFYHYVHENTITLYLDYCPNEGFEDDIHDLFVSLVSNLKQKIKDRCIGYYNKFDELYNELNSEETIDEEMIEKDSDYFIDGELCEYMEMYDSNLIDLRTSTLDKSPVELRTLQQILNKEYRIIPEKDTFHDPNLKP